MVDWSVFWPNLLTAIISSIITLLIGWLIAWRLIHRYQRRNIEMKNKNKLIEEISAFKISLRETTDSWLHCQREEGDLNLWYLARIKLLDLSNNREILFVKILNQFPEYFKRVFGYKDEKDKLQRFKLQDVAKCFKEYTTEFSRNLEQRKFSEDSGKVITDNRENVSLYLSHVLLELIREPLFKVMKKEMKN